MVARTPLACALSLACIPGLATVLALGGQPTAPPAAAGPVLHLTGPVPHITGPPPGHTGGFGEPTCIVCHEGNEIDAYGGSVTLDGLPAAYVPGERYTLRVVLTAAETEAAGFQLTARFSAGAERGQPAGVLAPLDLRVTTTIGESGQPYAHHTRAGTTVASDRGSTWSVEWRAPSRSGPVVFHFAANSGNGDDSPLSDLVFVGERTVGPPDPR